MKRAVANSEQAAAWDGEEGDRWVAYEEHYNTSIRRHTARLFDAARIGTDERVLDIGCGCGASTRAAARLAVSGSVLGVDLSARMIGRARERSHAEGIQNVSFEQADAQVHPFEHRAYDVAISRFGVMFFDDPVGAFRNVRTGLRPSGRLALLVWQAPDRNEWVSALRDALAAGRLLPAPPVGAPGPFGLADPSAVRRILSAAGFEDIALADVREPFDLGTDVDDALAFVRSLGMTEGMLGGLDAETRERALDAVREVLAAHDTGHGIHFDSRTWIITARQS